MVQLPANASICDGATPLILRNLAEDFGGSRYLWSTGATTKSITVNQPGVILLTVTSENGCATTEKVEVKKDCFIDIPNAFHPNGDGINDYFFPRQLLSQKVHRFRMTVYNRWGKVMFETDKINGRGWDGKCNTIDQPVGIYIYHIDVELAGGIQEKYTGNVTLIR